jgi:hypothetical protein
MEYCPQNAGVCITNRLFLLSSYAKSNSKPPAPYFAESIYYLLDLCKIYNRLN